MSLINDALKRARQTQRNDPPSGAPPLPPIEPPARGGTGWILVVAAVLFLAAVCLFVGSTVFGHKSPPVAAAKSPGIPMPPQTETTPAPAPPRADAAPTLQSVTSALPPPAIHQNPPATAVMEPLPRLQGIIFSATHPLAIVNGKTVSVGDQVGDFLVKQILKSSIVFQCPDGLQKTVDIGG